MNSVRPAAVAGQFYPEDPVLLQSEIDRLLQRARERSKNTAPKAIIVPHAGYPYSGDIAASAYVQLEPVAKKISRIVVAGPAHFAELNGIAVPSVKHFQTPIGEVEIDEAGRTSLVGLPQIVTSDTPHETEHSLEVQLPFLQTVFPSFQLIPILVGHVLPEAVSDVLNRVWGGPETLIVITTDLSHYLDYEASRKADSKTADLIERIKPESISSRQACGAFPLKGFLLLAQRKKLRIELLDLRNSGDTAGPRNRVVGYGAFACYET